MFQDPVAPEALTLPAGAPAKIWIRHLAKYRDPNPARSGFELAVTLLPFIGIWAAAWAMLSVSYWLAVALALVNGLFLVRIFCIQHDCGHGSFFSNSTLSDWVGRALGVLTITPYDVWRRSHAIHHGAAGNLDARGFGDIDTLTVEEYKARSAYGRFKYRLYRNPVTLFFIGPAYVFFLEQRLPIGYMKAGAKYWLSAMGTNVGIAVALGLIVWFGGIMPLLLVFIPSTMVAAVLGVWLFYVQHQFEETHWDHKEDWQVHEAALHGSSHYILPPVLAWFSANIGIHHVHHLYSRIPFYRLPEVLKDHQQLAEANRMSIRESIKTVGLQLWDEQSRRLRSFRDVHRNLLGSK
ncbi:omega-6 fatty acid desaturase (delta-12 desaturase) [Litoreibacter ascidiaceicola]|uniref:Omega-6 fatty acid desaturase (Delta-12 desaturase) n=1 Tax=Litoreibacter ascidiaceicola TaxID=1486859 RepID=A0A1M4VCC4_9RHOB|nr:fatty acid desaturase [Litoreibacter ascidiaceicola]SHE66596.1 omega-6 fatty acid desaturase (delta-12 desaturase) [Litoreibacter ascidiaceicola]